MAGVLKRVASLSGVGAVLGFLLWSVIGQSTTSMMYGSLGGTFTCAADVESALARFVMMQLYCAIGGAVLIPIVGLLISRSLRKRKAASAAPGGPATPG